MTFDTPNFLLLLFLVVPLALVMLIHRKRRRRGVEFIAAAAPSGARKALKTGIRLRIALSDLFFIIFTVLVIMGLAGPRWGVELVPDNRRGLDLVMAFDVSRSMNARDCPPAAGRTENRSRLEHAVDLARELCFRLDDVRFAAAAGKGRGVLMVPLTWDSETVLGFLDSLDDSLLTGAGTNLESLVDAASGAFRDTMNRRKCVIVFSDGEAHQGSVQFALDRSGNTDVIICAAGFGTASGAVIPVETSEAAPDGLLLAPDNSVVKSARDDGLLVSMAESSGGLFADSSRVDAAALLADFCKSLAAETEGGFRRESAGRWPAFVFPGIAAFFVSRLLGYRRRKHAILGLSCVLGLFLVSCSPIQGKILIMEGNFHYSGQRYNEAISAYMKALEYDDSTAYAQYGLGLCYSALQEYGVALEQYAEAYAKAYAEALESAGAGGRTELEYRTRFNMGIIHFEMGDYPDAADSFRKALEINGSSVDAKRNLELSLMSLARESSGETGPAEAAARTGSGEGQPGGEAAESGESEALERTQALFDFLRNKEQDKWKSEWAEDLEPLWPDY